MTPTIRTVARSRNEAAYIPADVTAHSPALRDAADTMALAGAIKAILYTVAAIVAAVGLILAGMAARAYLPTWVLVAGFFGVTAVVLGALWCAWSRSDEVDI